MNENINKVHQIIFFYKIILLMRIYLETLSLGDSLYGVHTMSQNDRSSRPEVFCRKGVLRNFAKLIGKHLYQSLFLNKTAGLKPATLLKNRLWHKCFPVNFVKVLRTPFFLQNTSGGCFCICTSLD